MHANLMGDDGNVKMALYGKRPKELDMTPTLRSLIAIFSDSGADDSETLHAVFYRRKWVATSPRRCPPDCFETRNLVRGSVLAPQQVVGGRTCARVEDLTAAAATYTMYVASVNLTHANTGFAPLKKRRRSACLPSPMTAGIVAPVPAVKCATPQRFWQTESLNSSLKHRGTTSLATRLIITNSAARRRRREFLQVAHCIFEQKEFSCGVLDQTTERCTGRKWKETQVLHALVRSQ